ncbi:FecR protein [Enhygromyxa salina]|uniref:FecR protein n=1 Tax=Enhygromyxa salina TaxID=215803 RepID=A0A2S9YGA6_9BACT|nr:FecR domain-containing protein [Enhygromyxa salina]PRQ04129.1 FecR protein [Enhygromyxa salina]
MSGEHEHEHDAQRWEALIDREVVGESLTADERAFVRRHEAAHPECAREREVWGAVLAQLDADSEGRLAEAEAEALERIGAAALAAHRAPRAGAAHRAPRAGAATARPGATSRAASRPTWARVAAVASLAAAAALALWFGARSTDEGSELRVTSDEPASDQPERPDELRPSPSPASSVETAPPIDLSGVVSMRTEAGPALGSAVGPGAVLTQPACVSWSEPTAVVCFEGEVELSPPRQPARAGERRVRLVEGRVVAALDPLGPGQRFTVETELGAVTAIGTVFAVELHEDRAWVTVLEGRVELRDPSPRVLEVGQRTSLRGSLPSDEPGPTELTPAALEQLAGLAGLLRASPGATQLRVPSHAGLSLRLDGHALVRDATQLSLAAGEHQLVVLGRDRELLAERTLSLEAGQFLDLEAVLEAEFAELAELAEDPERGDAPAKQPVPSAKQLARSAQNERAAGHHAETARLYRALLEHYPDSPEAVNVPVRLGDLLASTGDHQGALEAYELYLERGAKQLAPEAELGRIEALRQLGRHADEAAAIAAFLAAHPDDYRSAEIRAGLSSNRGRPR